MSGLHICSDPSVYQYLWLVVSELTLWELFLGTCLPLGTSTSFARLPHTQRESLVMMASQEWWPTLTHTLTLSDRYKYRYACRVISPGRDNDNWSPAQSQGSPSPLSVSPLKPYGEPVISTAVTLNILAHSSVTRCPNLRGVLTPKPLQPKHTSLLSRKLELSRSLCHTGV